METKLGDNDKIIRVALGTVLLIIGVLLNGVVNHALGIFVIIVAIYLLYTYVFDYEPIYKILKKPVAETPS